MRRPGVLLVGLLPCLWALNAWADPAPSSEGYARIALGASAHLGFAMGNSLPAPVSDTVSAGSGFMLTGLHLAPRWRASEQWSLGLLAGLAMHTRRESGPTDWWDAQAEARWYPLGAGAVEYWIAGNAGAVLAIDKVPAHVVYDGLGTVHPARTYRTLGPCAGLGVGFDGTAARFFAIGLELRTVVFGLYTGQSNGSDPTYRPHVGLTLGLNVTALISHTQG